jgi:hypothetical protein
VLRIDRRLLQNVDWGLLVVAFALIMMSSVTLASLHVGRAGGSVVIRQLLWFTIGLAVMVLVERGGHGGSAAAPIAKQIFSTIFLEKVAFAAFGG